MQKLQGKILNCLAEDLASNRLILFGCRGLPLLPKPNNYMQ